MTHANERPAIRRNSNAGALGQQLPNAILPHASESHAPLAFSGDEGADDDRRDRA